MVRPSLPQNNVKYDGCPYGRPSQWIGVGRFCKYSNALFGIRCSCVILLVTLLVLGSCVSAVGGSGALKPNRGRRSAGGGPTPNPLEGDVPDPAKTPLSKEDKEEMVRENEEVEEDTEERTLKMHRLDTINLMLYTSLLIMMVLTFWLFKHRRIPFIHETGITMIIGLVIGGIVKLTERSSHHMTFEVVPRNIDTIATFTIPTDYVQLVIPKENSSFVSYRYAISNTQEKNFDEKATFDPEIFFNILLPPIIFNAGYSLKRRHFFRNIGTILTFAVVGTTMSCIIVGGIMYAIAIMTFGLTLNLAQCLFFGALISATDPVTILAVFTDLHVDVDLFAIVFGESALNDAVAIVLSSTIDKYMPSGDDATLTFDLMGLLTSLGTFLWVFFGSFGLGAIVGCLCALITKFTKLADYPLLETVLFVLMSYFSFLAAEAAGMTGIVAVLFCGICQAHYTYNNLSEESQVRTKQFFELINFVTENFVFIYIGVSMFTSQSNNFKVPFIFGAFFAIALGRAAFVYPLSFLLNLGRNPKIPWNHQHMMFFSGLRGAVAFALAIRNTSSPARQVIFTTTSIIVICTVLVNGGLSAKLLKWLKIKMGLDSETELTPQFQPEDTGGSAAPAAVEGERSPVRGHYNPWDKAFFPRKWYNFDARFMKPLLTHSRPSLMESCPECCLPITRMLTSTRQMGQRDYHSHSTADLDLVAEQQQPDLSHYISDEINVAAFPGSRDVSSNGMSRSASSELAGGDLGIISAGHLGMGADGKGGSVIGASLGLRRPQELTLKMPGSSGHPI